MAATLALSALLVAGATAVNNGLASTPQMGWNTWNAFACNVNEDLLLSTASEIKKYGLLSVGFNYIVQDDCWSNGRNSSGALQWDSGKFPDGMPYIADQLHNEGFLFGIYSDAGNYTCGGYAGSLGYETIDANTWASWGVDYLKYDNCNNNGESGTQQASSQRYGAMATALDQSGREILYSICNWGEDDPWIWGPSIGNSWRITGDIWDSFDSVGSGYCNVPSFGGNRCPVTDIVEMAALVASYGAKGGWNDMDMLEIGNGGMSDSEYVLHFSMWAAAKSPLIMGNAMSSLPAADLSILLNAPVIAVSQDPLGIPAAQRWDNGDTKMWSGELVSTTGGTNDQVAVLINYGTSDVNVSALMTDIWGGTPPASNWEIRDLWGSRMSDDQAQNILDNGASGSNLVYDSTSQSYADGLSQADPMLLGTSIGYASSSDRIYNVVPAQGCRVLRFRAS